MKVAYNSRTGKVYVANASKGGAVQMAFKNQIGDPVGACVKQRAEAASSQIGSLSLSTVHGWARGCKVAKGTSLQGAFIHNGPNAHVERARKHSKILSARG